MICMAVAGWCDYLRRRDTKGRGLSCERRREPSAFKARSGLSIGLPFRNNATHTAPGLRAVALPAWDQMPVHMQNRLPGGLA
jgi:hypothetical protein